MIVEFKGGIIDGDIYAYPDDYNIEPIVLVKGVGNSLHEYRFMDAITDQNSGEKTYTFRFYQVLTVGEKRL